MSRTPCEDFFHACESPSPLRVLVTPPGPEPISPSPHTLEMPFAVVGRDPGCDIVLEGEEVLPRHCFLQAIGSKLLCVGLGTGSVTTGGDQPTHASWVDRRNGVRVAGHALVMDAGVVDSDGMVFNTTIADGILGEFLLKTRRLPRYDLAFRTGFVQTGWRLKQLVAFVGTAPSCAVRLTGLGIAPYHAAFVITNHGLWVVDLLGDLENSGCRGLFLNGQRVRFCRLGPDDLLGIGSIKVTAEPVGNRLTKGSSVPGPAPSLRPAEDLRPTAERNETPSVLGCASNGSATPPDALEALRNDYEARMAAQVAAHRLEVEELQRRIERLTASLTGLTGASNSQEVVTPSELAELPPATFPRSLGTAFRKPQPVPAASVGLNGDPAVNDATDVFHDDNPLTWSKVEGGGVATTHDRTALL